MKARMDMKNLDSTQKITVHHRRVVGALRVSPAVTRLTVYRRHQVMVAWMIADPSEANMVRSILLQVTGGRQSGQRGFLLLVFQ